MRPDYGKDPARRATPSLARTHHRCERCDRKPPDEVLAVHHAMSGVPPDGARDQTTSPHAVAAVIGSSTNAGRRCR